ncbi:hypothetical protein CVH10_18330 [Halomonas sp. ND22Bw]|nr:hypothetical protein CVH10_18330 [Halomonas sp. ND22Bw]
MFSGDVSENILESFQMRCSIVGLPNWCLWDLLRRYGDLLSHYLIQMVWMYEKVAWMYEKSVVMMIKFLLHT